MSRMPTDFLRNIVSPAFDMYEHIHTLYHMRAHKHAHTYPQTATLHPDTSSMHVLISVLTTTFVVAP